MASLSCPAADEVLSGVDALSVPLFDEEFALGPPMRLVRSDRVRLFGAGNAFSLMERRKKVKLCVPESHGSCGDANCVKDCVASR